MSFQNCKVVGKDVDPVLYHNVLVERGQPIYPVSPSMLRIGASNWRRWRDGYELPESEAVRWGSLLDTLETAPKAFESRYAVKPKTYKNYDGDIKPWNGNSNTCKAWLAENSDKEIVSEEEVSAAWAALKVIHGDETLHAFSAASDKQVHVAGEWKDEDTGLVVPVRCLLDYVPRQDTEFAKCLGDLKTTKNAGIEAWTRFAGSAGYHIQAAFGLDLYRAATGEDRVTWCFILSENYPPYAVGRRMMSDLEGQECMIGLGRKAYERALRSYCRCLKTGTWTGYDDTSLAIQGWTPVEPPAWMAYQDLSDEMRDRQESAIMEQAVMANDIIP